jgi:hypothetical protein
MGAMGLLSGGNVDEGNDGALPMDDKVRLMIAVSLLFAAANWRIRA